MLKDLLKVEAIKPLNKKQQTMIIGAARYSCVCIRSVGAWEGSYSGASSIAAAISTWCASGEGTCSAIGSGSGGGSIGFLQSE